MRTVAVSPEEFAESFAAYMAVRIVIDILRASSLMLFEGAVVVIIKVNSLVFSVAPIHRDRIIHS